jgi:two-component system NtrC family sensor kinase
LSRELPSETAILAALTKLGRSLTGGFQPHQLVTRVARALDDLLSPDRLLVVLRQTPETATSVIHTQGWSEETLEHPVVEWVNRTGPVVVPRDVESVLSESGVTFEESPGALVASPIVAGPQIVGTVVIVSDKPDRYGHADLAVMEAVLTQSAIALVNARLLQLLSDGKREWEQTVDAIPQAFCIIGPRGTIRRANRAFAAVVRTPVTALADRPWRSVIPQEWHDPVTRALAAAGTGAHFELKTDVRLFQATALRVDLAVPDTSVLVLEDQTDKRTLQDQVVQSAKMSAIGQLIAGIAHDLNNPLASVVGFAEYLVEGRDDTPPRLMEPLRAIHQEAERASKIVRSLLAFARKQEGDRRAMPVGPVLESTLLLLKNQMMTYKVEATANIPPDLPPIEGNANQLQQVFVNLVTNAAQAAQERGNGGNITITAEPWLDGVAVIIQDDGPGIPGHIADRIFEPFFTTKPEGQGTGLGLSICYGIVTEHGGQIRLLESKRGAAFRVELPGGTPAKVTAVDYAEDATGLRILVVDDEPHILHYMRVALEEWGHSVMVAPDGKDAYEAATTGDFDVIITDLRMPNVGGREFFESLETSHPGIARHVVFCTGDTVGGDTLAFLETVGRPHLKKPFSLAELRAILPAAARGFPD